MAETMGITRDKFREKLDKSANQAAKKKKDVVADKKNELKKLKKQVKEMKEKQAHICNNMSSLFVPLYVASSVRGHWHRSVNVGTPLVPTSSHSASTPRRSATVPHPDSVACRCRCQRKKTVESVYGLPRQAQSCATLLRPWRLRRGARSRASSSRAPLPN